MISALPSDGGAGDHLIGAGIAWLSMSRYRRYASCGVDGRRCLVDGAEEVPVHVVEVEEIARAHSVSSAAGGQCGRPVTASNCIASSLQVITH